MNRNLTITRDGHEFSRCGDGNVVHESVVVDGDVRIGSRNYIGPGTTLIGPLEIGDDCYVIGASIGAPPEHDEWYAGDRRSTAGVWIGNRCIIREFVTINAGLGRTTILGDGCFVMNKGHVAHDCILGDGVYTAGGVMIGGHVTIGDHAYIGMTSCIHPRLTIGKVVMIGMNSTVTRDLDDHVLAYGSPAKAHGLNEEGLRRLAPAPMVLGSPLP